MKLIMFEKVIILSIIFKHVNILLTYVAIVISLHSQPCICFAKPLSSYLTNNTDTQPLIFHLLPCSLFTNVFVDDLFVLECWSACYKLGTM